MYPLYIFLVSALIGIIAYYRLQYLGKVSRYRKRRDHIYVVGMHPTDSTKTIDLPDKMKEVVVFVEHDEVVERCMYEMEWLEHSKNPFLDSHLKPNQKIQVIAIIPNDGIHRYETWDQYTIRVYNEINMTGSEWHRRIKAQKADYYHKHLNGQRGVKIEWEVKKIK